MIEDPHALKIYIDGNAYGNPGGPGEYAWMAVYPDDWNREPRIIFQVGFQNTTNNGMELSACIHAYEYIREQVPILNVQRIQIVTDSLYVYDYHRIAPMWKKNDWKTRDGRQIDNDDLWDRLLSVQPKVRIRTEIIWKKGKKNALLKAIDKAAKEAGTQPWEIDRGFREGKVAPSKVAGRSASQLFPAKGQEAIIRIYRSGIVGRSSHRIFFDFYSESQKTFTAKYRAYTSAELALELHRHHIYRVRFNDNPKNPVIEAILEEIDKTAAI